MTRTVRLIAGVLLIATNAACAGSSGTSTGTASPAATKITIAVIPKGTSHIFWRSVHAGALKAAEELGVEVIWRGPVREDDREAQIAEVEGFVSRGVSGIVLAPLDDTALIAPVDRAVQSRIPVVVIDSGLKGGSFTSFVATDNNKGGELGGAELARILGGRGKVVLMRYAEGHDSSGRREQGFLDAIKAAPGIEVVSENQYAGIDVESAYKKGESLLSRYKKPDGSPSIDGVFCPNESTTFAMMRVLQTLGWSGKVKFVGFDSSDRLALAMKEGAIDALVVQDPVKMGYLGVKTMVSHLKGEKVDARIDTGVTLVTKATMDNPAVRELLSPDLSKWLKQ
jgi:ribose transport system substrate-binding protein